MSIQSTMPTKFLVADDSRDFAGRLAERLSELPGIEIVGPAHDGRDAMRFFEQTHPHGVVVDLQLASTNGLDLLAEFRLRNPLCLVIMITVHDYIELQEMCLRAGADYFISKSRDIDRVVSIVREFSEVRA